MATKVIAGLGNPPAEFYQASSNPDFALLKEMQAAGKFRDTSQTPHNAGFQVLNVLGANSLRFDADLNCNLGLLVNPKNIAALVQPMTAMNSSGTVIKAVLDHYGLGSADLLVVYDDIALPLGTLRYRREGSSGGHRGVQSVIDQLGAKFDRLKVGVGPVPKGMTILDFVLSAMPESAAAHYSDAIVATVEACIGWIGTSK